MIIKNYQSKILDFILTKFHVLSYLDCQKCNLSKQFELNITKFHIELQHFGEIVEEKAKTLAQKFHFKKHVIFSGPLYGNNLLHTRADSR